MQSNRAAGAGGLSTGENILSTSGKSPALLQARGVVERDNSSPPLVPHRAVAAVINSATTTSGGTLAEKRTRTAFHSSPACPSSSIESTGIFHGPPAPDHPGVPARPLLLARRRGAQTRDVAGSRDFAGIGRLRRQRDHGLPGEGFRRGADAGRAPSRTASRPTRGGWKAGSPASPIAPIPAPRSWKCRAISRRN